MNNQKEKYKPTIEFLFAWYDLWIGAFWDKRKKWLYIFPVPMFGFVIKFGPDIDKIQEKLVRHISVEMKREMEQKTWEGK